MAAIFVFAIIVILDQAVKCLVASSMQLHSSIPVLDGVFHWSYQQNTGAGLSILEGHTSLLAILSAVISLVLFYLLLKKKVTHPLGYWSLVFLLGGAAGNLIDRIFRGYVVDFIDVRIINFPVFNIADIFVTIGAGMLILYLLFFYGKTVKKNDD